MHAPRIYKANVSLYFIAANDTIAAHCAERYVDLATYEVRKAIGGTILNDIITVFDLDGNPVLANPIPKCIHFDDLAEFFGIKIANQIVINTISTIYI